MLVQEHLYQPISGKVLTLGRQLIPMGHGEAVDVLIESGLDLSQETIDATRDMVDTEARYSEGQNYLSDHGFFRLLDLEGVQSMDVTDYEGCDIVHNLNHPIPAELVGAYDFIIDGGTFDHLVDLRMCFENVIKMLKPGGRIFQWNAASCFTGAAYISFGPDLFYDYYVANRFADCKVYIAEADDISQPYDWDLYYFQNPLSYAHFQSPKLQMVLVIAEKGEDSTCDVFPVQAQYRNEEMASHYKVGIDRCKASKRPLWHRIIPKVKVVSDAVANIHTSSALSPASAHTPPPQGFLYIGKL